MISAPAQANRGTRNGDITFLGFVQYCDHFLNRYPNFCSATLRSSTDGVLTAGNLSRQCHGLQASIMARLLVLSPAALRSGSMRGSSGVDQAFRMMSIEVAGSDRVMSAQTTCRFRNLDSCVSMVQP